MFTTILVTGGAGYEVIVADNLSNSKCKTLSRINEITGKEITFYKVDIRDRENSEKIFAENIIDAVIHFAGLKAVDESVQIPLHYYHNNISSTLILFEVMNKYNVKKMVFSSSATVYGAPESVPISEDFPLSATNPYAKTKLMIEEILRDLYHSDNTWIILLLRYFNPIGAHESGRIGEDPNGIPNNLMPYITQVAVGKLKELHVFGNDYPTIDGTGVRDYIHVVDLAKGHLKAFERILTTTGIEVYNLGTGKGYSVFEIVAAFKKVSGKKVPNRIVERRPGDIASCYADPKKAKEELGWAAEKGIEEMCRDAWRWQVKNPNGYDKKISF